MSLISWIVRLIIRQHWWILLILITTQFLVGTFTEGVADILQYKLRQVIQLHKLNGQLLAIVGFVLGGVKLYIWVSEMPRGGMSTSLQKFAIRNHWLLFIFLLPLQYITTVLAKQTASLLGLQIDQVFSFHGVIAFMLQLLALFMAVVYAMLYVQKNKTKVAP